MRIEQLQLLNFGSYRSATFEFDERISLIYGPNNSGKSTIAQAIEYVLTGRTLGTDARGAGADVLVLDGQEGLKAGLQISTGPHERPLVAVRGLTGKKSVLTLDGEAVERDDLWRALKTSDGVLTALCRSRAFLDLGHAAAKDLLLDVLHVKVSVGGRTYTLAQLDTAYAEAFEARKLAKAQLNAIRVSPAPTEDAPDVAALQDALAWLREQERGLLIGAAVGDGRRVALESERQTAANDQARVEQALEKTADYTAAIAELDERLALLEPPDGQETQAHQHRTALATADGRLPMLERTLHQIQHHDPKKGCVLDATIPCQTASRHFAGQVSKLDQEIVSLKVEKDTAREALEALQQSIAIRINLEGQLAALRGKQASRDQLVARERDLTATRDRLHNEIAALPPPAQPSPGLEALQARIAKGERTIAEASGIVQAWARHTDDTAKQQTAAKAVQVLETKVEQLGPKGARVQALEAAVAAFEGLINDALARFHYDVKFQIDPWDVRVNGRTSARLSESERLRVGLALQLALADVTKLGFVVIDGVDLLLPSNRAVLVELLEESAGVQIILTCSKEEPPEPMDGVCVYWIEMKDGVSHVERVGLPVTA